jgi:hypothetical protein
MTRKLLPALCLITFATLPAAAQEARPNFIANLGFTWSTLGGSDATSGFKSRNGFFGGLGYQVPFHEGLSGRFEVNYETKGVELPSDAEARYGVQTAYVDVPLMVQYTFGTETGNILPAIFVGPQVGFEVSCNAQTLTGTGFYDQKKCVEPPTRNKFVFDFALGGQVAISHIVLGLRYAYGVTRIIKDSDYPSLKNRSLAVTVGYTF